MVVMVWEGVLVTSFCDEDCRWLATGQWFSLDTLISSTNKTDFHDIGWTIVESDVKHQKPNQPLTKVIGTLIGGLGSWPTLLQCNCVSGDLL